MILLVHYFDKFFFSQVILKTTVALQEIEFNNKSNDHQFCFSFALMSSQVELVPVLNEPVNLETMGTDKYRQRCKSNKAKEEDIL